MSTSTRFKLLLFGFYLVLTAFLAAHHEPWRDEADTWLMARDASFSTILKISPHAGTPVLWHFFLKLFADQGFSYGAQPVINLLLVWAAVAFLLVYSPFSCSTLLYICFGWLLSFEYPAVARNYAFGFLGLMLLLSSFSSSKRWASLILGFLAWPILCFSSVHYLALVPALMLLQLYCFDGGTHSHLNKAKVLWPLFWFCLAVYTLWPQKGGQFNTSFIHIANLYHFFWAVSLGLFPGWSYKGIAAFIAPFLLFWIIKRTNPEIPRRKIIYFMLFCVNAIFVFKYFIPMHRFGGFNWLVILVSSWIGLLLAQRTNSFPELSKKVAAFYGLLFVLNFPGTFVAWKNEIQKPFTDAGSTTRFLEENDYLKLPIACFTGDLCSALLVYTPEKIKFWYPGIDDWGTHMFWDKRYKDSLKLSPVEAYQRSQDFFDRSFGETPFLFISHFKLERPEDLGLKLIWESPHQAWMRIDETFYVYLKSY
ncbi:hypothetical protein EBR03_07415 [bacterium]|nr:hypothetical protein [bacterium]